MNKKRLPPVVILSSIDWDAAWQRHQIFAAQFVERGHPVFFVENTGFRSPRLGDSGRLWSKLRHLAQAERSSPVNTIPGGMHLIAPQVLPPTNKLFRKLNNSVFLPQLIASLLELGLDDAPIIFAYMPSPTTVEIVKHLGGRCVVYDCASNFRGHPDAPKSLVKTEGALLGLADLVVCDSDFLYKQKRAEHSNVEQIHQGVAEPFFEAKPARGLRSFCYYGTWVPDLDHDFLSALAEEGFEVTVSGFMKGPPPPFHPAVKRLPPAPREKLVQRLEQFDAFLLPHKINPFMLGVVPAKIYECLAMGRPVLARPLPSLLPLAEKGLIYIGETAEDWRRIARDLPRTESAELRARRVAEAREHTHEREFLRLVCAVESADRPIEWKAPSVRGWASKSARVFLRGFLFLGSFYGGARALTLFGQAIAGRLYGPEVYGHANLAMAMAAFLQIAPILGFPVAAAKLLADTTDERRRADLISTTFWLFGAWTLFCFSALWLCRPALAGLLGLSPRLVTLSLGLSLATAVHTVISSPLLGLHRFSERGLAELIYGVISTTALVALTVSGVPGESAIVAALCVGLVAAAAYAGVTVRRYVKLRFDPTLVRPLLSYAVVASVNLLTVACILSPARLLLHQHFSAKAVGLFSAYFTTTGQLALALLTMSSSILVPLAGAPDARARWWKALGRRIPLLAAGGTLFFASIAAVGLLLFGRDYPIRLDWLLIFGAAAALMLIHGIAAALLTARDFRGLRLSAAGSLLAGASNVGLSAWMIPRWGIDGAGAALALSYVMGLLCYVPDFYAERRRRQP